MENVIEIVMFVALAIGYGILIARVWHIATRLNYLSEDVDDLYSERSESNESEGNDG